MSTMSTKKYCRWVPVIASIVIQMCLGTAYIWSVFQSYLIISPSTPKALFHWPATYGALAYALLLGVLSLGSTIGGRIQDKYKTPKPVIIAAGIIMGISFFIHHCLLQRNKGFFYSIFNSRYRSGSGVCNYIDAEAPKEETGDVV